MTTHTFEKVAEPAEPFYVRVPDRKPIIRLCETVSESDLEKLAELYYSVGDNPTVKMRSLEEAIGHLRKLTEHPSNKTAIAYLDGEPVAFSVYGRLDKTSSDYADGQLFQAAIDLKNSDPDSKIDKERNLLGIIRARKEAAPDQYGFIESSVDVSGKSRPISGVTSNDLIQYILIPTTDMSSHYVAVKLMEEIVKHESSQGNCPKHIFCFEGVDSHDLILYAVQGFNNVLVGITNYYPDNSSARIMWRPIEPQTAQTESAKTTGRLHRLYQLVRKVLNRT